MLNKNGWGFRAFLISGAVLFVALLVTAFLVMRLYSGLPDLSSFLSEPLSYQRISTTQIIIISFFQIFFYNNIIFYIRHSGNMHITD